MRAFASIFNSAKPLSLDGVKWTQRWRIKHLGVFDLRSTTAPTYRGVRVDPTLMQALVFKLNIRVCVDSKACLRLSRADA
jgi:hypothetical protein